MFPFDQWILSLSSEGCFCSLYSQGSDCIDRCENSTAKTTLLATLAPLNYICVQHFNGQSLYWHLEEFFRGYTETRVIESEVVPAVAKSLVDL